MRRKLTAVPLILTGALVLAACSSSGEGEANRGDPDAASASGMCKEFSGAVEPNKTPAPTPEGDPSKPATLTAVKQQVIDAVGDIDKTAQYCAEGQETLDKCDVAYWHDSYSQVPPGVPTQSCNFFYLRVNDQFWREPTRVVIDEYGDYLKLHADGTDPQNYSVGPHTTLVEQGNADTFFETGDRGPYLQIQLDSNGNLFAAGVNNAVTTVVKAIDGTGKNGAEVPQPVLASDQMTPQCDQVWEYSGDKAKKPVSEISVTAGEQFLCQIDTQDQGTAYTRVTLTDPSKDGSEVGASFDIQQAGETDSLLRKPTSQGGTSAFTVDNIIWPVATEEVVNAKTEQVSVPDQCSDGANADPLSCVHLWVTGGESPYDKGCKLWMVLEIDKSAVAQTLENYQVDTSGLTAHISLAKSDTLKAADAQTCRDAAALNKQAGLAADGNPPANLATLD